MHYLLQEGTPSGFLCSRLWSIGPFSDVSSLFNTLSGPELLPQYFFSKPRKSEYCFMSSFQISMVSIIEPIAPGCYLDFLSCSFPLQMPASRRSPDLLSQYTTACIDHFALRISCSEKTSTILMYDVSVNVVGHGMGSTESTTMLLNSKYLHVDGSKARSGYVPRSRAQVTGRSTG